MPGVLAVLTGADVVADGLKDVPHTPIPSKPPADILLTNRDGSAHGYAPQELLPTDRVRYVGQQVVDGGGGEHRGRQGRRRARRGGLRAAQAAVTETPGAAKSDVRLYDHVGNVCIDADVGDVEATKAAFARAAHVAKFDTWVQRVTGVPLDAARRGRRLRPGDQQAHAARRLRRRGAAEARAGRHPRRAADRRARRVRRRRRQLRHAQRLLSGIRAGGAGRRSASAGR